MRITIIIDDEPRGGLDIPWTERPIERPKRIPRRETLPLPWTEEDQKRHDQMAKWFRDQMTKAATPAEESEARA